MKPEKPIHSHSLTLQNAAAVLLAAGRTYGFYNKQADEAADKLTTLIQQEGYKAFRVTHLLNNVSRYGVHAPHVADKIVDTDLIDAVLQAVYRALMRSGGIEAVTALIGPEERPHFTNIPIPHEPIPHEHSPQI